MGHTHCHALRLLLLFTALAAVVSACDPLSGSEASLACTPAPGAAHHDTVVRSPALERRHTLAISTQTDSERGSGHAAGEEDESRRQLAAWAVEAATLLLPSSCDGAVPDRTALVTYTNGHHFDLLVLQVRSAETCSRECSSPCI